MKDGSLLWRRFAEDGEVGAVISGQPLIEILGSCRVLIEGHRGVREYTDERIRVGVKGGCVLVCGRGLEVRSMTAEQLVITGRIQCVEVTGREGA